MEISLFIGIVVHHIIIYNHTIMIIILHLPAKVQKSDLLTNSMLMVGSVYQLDKPKVVARKADKVTDVNVLLVEHLCMI